MRSQDIFEHQVRSLVSMVQRWSAGGRSDKTLERRLKGFVLMELLGHGNADVIARAMGEFDDVEADVLQNLVTHCSQSFDHSDEVWNAFAVPMAVRWHMQHHHIFIARRGQGQYLSELAAGIRQCVGAERVVLDTSIYNAKALFSMSAHALHDHLQVLLNAAPRFAKAPSNMELRSSSEPPWRIAYFLGVEVTKPGGKRQLNDPGVQEALQSYLNWGVDALTKTAVQGASEQATPSPFDQGAYGTTICHAPLYLLDAIQFGEKAMRGYRLRQLLDEMAKVDTSATLFYAFNPNRYAFDLLLKGKWLAYQLRWSFCAVETVEEAFLEVRTVIENSMTTLRCRLVPVEIDSFQKKLQKTSLALIQWRTS